MIHIQKEKAPEFLAAYVEKNPTATYDTDSYDPDGYMRGDEYTISLLNLNSYELRKARKAVYRMISTMTEQDIRLSFCSDQTSYWPYSNVIFWYLKEWCQSG